MIRYIESSIAVLLIASAFAGALAEPSQVVSTKSGLNELLENAKKEGQLDLVWGEGTLGGSGGIAKMAELFNRSYGLNLNVRFTPGPSQSEMTGRIVEEFKANQPSTTDVFYTEASTMVPVVQAGALQSVDWSWASNVKRPEQVFPQGLGLAVQTALSGFTYNTDILSGGAVPGRFADLLAPEYRGRIAATPYAAQFDRLVGLWGRDKTIDFASKLSGQLLGLIRCGDIQRIVDGEFYILAPDCNQGPALVAKGHGLPVDYIVPSDADIMFYYVVAIPKNAAHPNAAKLWANFMLSREAQDVIYASDGMDSHLIEGSKTLPFIQKYEGVGTTFLTQNLDYFEKRNMGELNQIKRDAAKILSQK